jgi:hypothetical protein
MYGPFTNERLVGERIADRRDQVVLATKFGNVRRTRTARSWASTDARSTCGPPATPVLQTARRRPHRPLLPAPGATRTSRSRRPSAPWPSWSRRQGPHLGLSEASADTIRRAHAVHPITALQSEYSLLTRDLEDEILPTLRELGIGLVPYSPLGRGFLTGTISSTAGLGENDFRRSNPGSPTTPCRSTWPSWTRSRALRREIGRDRGPGRPGLGAGSGRRRRTQSRHQTGQVPRREMSRSAGLELTDDDLAQLAAAVP